jgi:signal transduction histidine kinase
MPDPSPPAAIASGSSKSETAERRWYRSLYWRFALGLIAFLALMLAAEAGLFLWVTERIAGSMPAQSPRRLAVLVASDVGTAIAADATLDVERYVRDQYGHVFQTFVVIMRDGRVTSNHDDVPEELLETARAEISFRERFREFRGRGQGPPRPRREPSGTGENSSPGAPGDNPPSGGFDGGRGDGRGSGFDPGPGPGRGPDFGPGPAGQGPRPGDRFDDRRQGLFDGGRGDGPGGGRGDGPGSPGDEPRRPPIRRGEIAPILLSGAVVGTVAVLPGGPPFSRVVRQFGPTVGVAAGGVLVVGTTLIALLVFGPARRRLKQVQEATERLGGGNLDARAPEQGGDEVAALARSFNRMADELTTRTQALEASDKARRQLLADVSHELMTPLTAMRGYIETLGMTDLDLDAQTRERYLRIVTEETHRLERIVGDLLDMARLEGGGTTMRREPVVLATLFERVAERHERELSAREIELTHCVEPGAERVTGDADRLEQVLQNLAANALRHTPDGGEISLTAAPVDGGVRIAVKDSGLGIPEEHLPLIFDRFYKADAARRAAGGSGLGLSIVKAIVERHGGSIAARNDNGAVFEITLPA